MKKEIKIAGFNVPDETITSWQCIADFIITAHIDHAIGDKQFEKLNALLGKMIARYLRGEE